MKDAEKCMAGNSESYAIYKNKLEKLPNNIVIIGSQTQSDNRKEKVQVLIICTFANSSGVMCNVKNYCL